MRTAGMPLMAAHSKNPEQDEDGATLRVRRGKTGAWLVGSDGRKVVPPATIAFRVPLTKNLRQKTGLKESPLFPRVLNGRLLFDNGTSVPLAELEPWVRLRVA